MDIFGIVSNDSDELKRINSIKTYCRNSEFSDLGEINDTWLHICVFERFKKRTTEKQIEKVDGCCSLRIGSVIHGGEEDKSLKGHYLELAYFPHDNEFFIKNDPTGTVNLYYSVYNKTLIFSTSSLILAAYLPAVTLDAYGALEFLSISYPIGDKTFYQEIKLQPPATEWHLTPDSLPYGKQKIWWHPPSAESNSRNPDKRSFFSIMSRELPQAANEIAHHYPLPYCDITGGYDSRGIVGSFIRSGLPFGTVVNGLPSSPDVQAASGIADLFKLRFIINDTEQLKTELDLPLLDNALLLTDGEINLAEYALTSIIQKRTAQMGGASVNGSGGELFRGYWWEREFPLEGKRERVNLNYLLKRLISSAYNWNVHPAGTDREIHDRVEKSVKALFNEIGPACNGRKIDYLYLKFRVGRWYARYYSSTLKIVPCFSPFLLSPVLETAFLIPPLMKRRKYLYRRWLVNLNAKLAWTPTEDGAPAAPFDIAHARLFFPRAMHYWGKIKKRALKRKLVGTSAQVPDVGGRIIAIYDKEYGIMDILDPNKMLTGSLYHKKRLNEMIRQYKTSSFILNADQLIRILTLELAFLKCEEIRRNLISSQMPSLIN
ncbi:MAG: hypothetical protein DRI57_01820 [Deltaproteobacteria bacterium]|nr:MAG: hypothetical protein DRI57_01820 [Deltaproteobacteria bacterium]